MRFAALGSKAPILIKSAPAISLALTLSLVAGPSQATRAEVWIASDDLRIGPDLSLEKRGTESSNSSAPSDPQPSTSDPSIIVSPPSLGLTDTPRIELFGLRGETVAFQIAIRPLNLPLQEVRVEILAEHQGESFPLDIAWVDRFVSFSIPALRQTANTYSHQEESLGWFSTSSKPSPAPIHIPDALIPVEDAPDWAPYPLRLATGKTGTVWVDITIPDDAAGGDYRGRVHVREASEEPIELSLSLRVKPTRLPFRAAKTAIFYDPRTLEERIGPGKSELELWRILHRHHLAPILSIRDIDDLARLLPAIEGSAFTTQSGYSGPGIDIGEDVVVLGTYGALGEPTPESIARVFEIVYALAASPRPVVPFLYAIDERCGSNRTARWRRALRDTGDPLLIALRVGETCHLRPPARHADLAMVPSASVQMEEAIEAREAGKWVWVYNGQRPRSGSLMLDASPLDLRANGWIASAFEIDRWFYWESIFWNDINSGGRGPIDPFATAENFHNAGGDKALGDGLLLYPGRQLGFQSHSIGRDTVIPSIRLKNLRRGIQDAGYVALVASERPQLAERIVRQLIPLALDELSTSHDAPSWHMASLSFRGARRALWESVPDNLELDDESVAAALREVAIMRRSGLDLSTDASPRRFPLAMLVGVAVAWISRSRARVGNQARPN